MKIKIEILVPSRISDGEERLSYMGNRCSIIIWIRQRFKQNGIAGIDCKQDVIVK